MLLIRPEAARLVEPGEASGENMVDGYVQSVSFRGRFQIVTVTFPNTDDLFKFELDTAVDLPVVGQEIRIAINAHQIQPLTRG